MVEEGKKFNYKMTKKNAIMTMKEFKTDACKEAISMFREAKDHTSSIFSMISNRNKVTIHSSKSFKNDTLGVCEFGNDQIFFVRKLDRSKSDAAMLNMKRAQENNQCV